MHKFASTKKNFCLTKNPIDQYMHTDSNIRWTRIKQLNDINLQNESKNQSEILISLIAKSENKNAKLK